MAEEHAIQNTQDPPASLPPKFSTAESVASVFRAIAKWGGLALIAYFAKGAVEALAGQTTVADLGLTVRTFASLRVSEILAWALGAAGVGYGLSQRQLRRKTIERLQGRNTALEARIDPGRTTSGLTARGETHPEDR